ncbi:membrane protein insertase YidC [Pseudosulfitobacter sp. DSM 107133]|uniref:membrane protein insertase YidC n=1 Tax=Pseudosulfitobacter sp. DSM 107133 TaxID=2883100 RepID=UPI000DF2A5F9|nr:membrane protein insertase YidC [Pseudosulfitobacter sp. DSM 107133]UOA28270.1 Membrane protein insertase YidC [Pseudosulfitobacter sp. DSM 107133]
MDDQNKNLILATALSFVVILVWFVMFPPPEPDPVAETPTEQVQTTTDGTGTVPAVTTDQPTAAAPGIETPVAPVEAPRIKIDTARMDGSISLAGGRIDDLRLKDYHVTIEPGSEIVTMLAPVGSPDAYYALQGWAPAGDLAADAVPGPSTEWTQVGDGPLTVDTPVTLEWNNGNGLTFRREISVDSEYMFDITQSVRNDSTAAVRAAPYGMVVRHGEPSGLKKFFILHEGAVAMADGELSETKWDEIPDADVDPAWGRPAIVTNGVTEGWIGFSDHYWQTILVPESGTTFDQALTYDQAANVYRAVTRLPTRTIEPGQTVTSETRMFAGPKEWEVLQAYQKDGISGFVDSIDWGWFFFLTKPIFWLLHELHKLIGNMGLSIITLTLIIKAVLFPLAYKSYVSMARMKELQPEMEKLKADAGDDRQKVQQGMMELYKKNKVNPAAGCLPILMQIPIFFSLYKVIFVTIELRHAPFFGPFQDLSAPDPTSIYNLFGALPWAAPEAGTTMALIFIGILPLLLGISMFLQQKLNPAPTDATQQMIFAWMPWVFMFMLGGFASGLVVYWIANNTITFTQQYLIMRSQGYTPDILGNIKGGFKRTPKDAKK